MLSATQRSHGSVLRMTHAMWSVITVPSSEFKIPKVTYDFVHNGEDHIVENPKGASAHDISESLLIDAETVDIPESVVLQMTNRSFSSARVRLQGCRICQHSKAVRMNRKVHIYTRILGLN